MTETTALNGRDNSRGAGVAAMNALTPAERKQRRARLTRFLDSGEAGGMTIDAIAEAVGVSASGVYNEFVRRGVKMTPGVKATYKLPEAKQPRKVAPHGEALQKIQAYLETGGTGNLTQIAEATGVPRSTVGTVMAKMTGGLAPAPDRPEPAVTRKAALAQVEEMTALPGAGTEPEGKLAYLHQISDGRHAFVDLLTGRLWVPDSFRPL